MSKALKTLAREEEILCADTHFIFEDCADEEEKKNSYASLTRLEEYRKGRVTKILVPRDPKKHNEGK